MTAAEMEWNQKVIKIPFVGIKPLEGYAHLIAFSLPSKEMMQDCLLESSSHYVTLGDLKVRLTACATFLDACGHEWHLALATSLARFVSKVHHLQWWSESELCSKTGNARREVAGQEWGFSRG